MEEKIRNQKGKVGFLLKLGFCFALLLVAVLLPNVCYGTTESGYKYLSDEDIDPTYAHAAWDTFRKNQINDGSLISVKIEGTYYTFEKGLWAHAASTLIYDLREYDYDYFTAYIGLNQTAGGQSNGVVYKIYTSTNGTDWHIQYNEDGEVSKRGDDADFVKIDIRNEKFLKLEIGSNGGNGGDHSVYADAKLIKEGYKEPGEELVPSITELDTKIKKFVASNVDLSNKEYELTLLKRELISRMGDYALRKFLGESEANRALYRWLTGDVDILRLYVMGGKPDGGNYYTSLSILTKLYEEYSSDFKNEDFIERPAGYSAMTYGELYKKMAMSVALTHTQRVGLWMNSSTVENQSEPLRRYAIFKYLHKNGGMRMSATMDMTHQFEDLHIAEMRLVLYNNIDDEEILWLNRYTQDNIDANPNNVWRYQTPHPYIAYVWPNYANPVYFENEEYFNELFAINKTENNVGKELKTGKIGLFDSEFVIPGGKNVKEYRIKVTKPKVIENTAEGTIEKKTYKVWMNFRNKFGTGCVCGGISKSGANIRGTHGIPAMVIGQPGHAALLFYSKDAQGRGFWRIDNDVSGWTASGGGGRLLGWGSGSYASGFSNGVYVELEQAAINDYQNLIKAEEQVMLAKVYAGDLTKQEEIYRKVVGTKSTNNGNAKKGIQSINFDAWLGLIDVYNASTNKSEDDYYELAEEVAEALKYFPLPMYNATNLIKPKLTRVENVYRFTLLQTRTLTSASTLPNNTADSFTVMQPGVTRVEANFLLGKIDTTVATFSFDGVDAGKIVLASRFSGNGVRWDYCLNGNTQDPKSWTEVSFTGKEENKLQLSPEELASITAGNDIYVHIVGVKDYSEKNLYKIDITEQALPTILYPSDLENRIIGTNLGTEWRYKENDSWTSYSVSSPDLTGNKTVQVRQSATGTKLASSASPMYTFTEDNQPETRKYIPVSHLSIHSVSTQATSQGRLATNAIDANYNTNWHSAWNGTDTQRFITIKLDKPVYLSAVEFVPAGGGNGRIVKGTVYGSMTGEDNDWEILANNENTPFTYPQQANTNEQAIAYTKSFEIEEPKEVQYVKIVANQTNGNWFTARAFNLYQDLTANPHPTAGIAYSTTEKTNEPVVARLINPSTEIKITNNDGRDSYVFTENGKFTFEFVDKKGNKGSATAKVDWIDTDEPTADINYNLDDDRKLLVLLDNISEDVYILDEDNRKINYIEVDNNKKVTNITYLDNEGKAYKVLDKDASGDTTKITYKNTVKDTMQNPTEKMKEVETYITIFEKKEDGIVTNEKYLDKAGNDVTNLTDEDKEALRKLQETARSNPLEYALETSGEYEFKLVDKSGNLLYKSIKVDYIENSNIIIASEISYSTTTLTNKDVVATINPYIIDDTTGERVSAEIVNNDKNKTYTFTKSGKFTFEYKDASDTDGDDIKQHTATVDWIDKDNPTAEVQYRKSQETNQVTATLVNESEDIIVINNGGKREYTFTESGEFIFEFQDKAGNKGTVTAKATIDDTTVKGDIDGDGELTINDMARLKLHLISIKEIEEEALGKADVDEDGEITISDLARMKLMLLGL